MISWETLERYGIRVPRFARAATLADAQAAMRAFSPSPICLKAETDLHKSLHGLVITGLQSEPALAGAWERITANAERVGIGPPFLVQEMIEAGPELFVGVKCDATFGPLLVAGIGGRLVESIRRRAMRLLPITSDVASQVIDELGLPELEQSSTDSFAATLVAVSQLIADHDEIRELDLNPVILRDGAAVAVDLRVVTSDEPTLAPSDADRPPGASNAAIKRLLEPRSVAVIGASSDRSKPGGRVCGYLATHAPGVRRYLVGRGGGEIDGEHVMERVDELPEDVDVAVVATPAATVAGIVRELGERHVPVAVVFASGFREAGAEELERQVAQAALEAGVRLCGVNGMGVIGDAPLTFTQALGTTPIKGGVSFVTQSGAIGGSLLIGSWANGLGTARWVSVGNETDLSLADYLDFLAHDDATSTVGVFLEGVADGRHLRRALHGLREAGKGVVVLRTGASEVAATAVRTHTGALAGSDIAYRQVLHETGAVRVADLPELLGACQALEWQPHARGVRVGVLSTSGGGCSLVADELVRQGLDVPELEPDARARLAEVLPSFAATRNPVDTTGNIAGDPTLLGRAINPVLGSDRVDAVVIAISALVGAAAKQFAEAIIDVARTATKPIVVGWMLPETTVAEAFRLLRANRIPVFDSITVACAAVAALAPRPANRHGVALDG